jgi:trehalose/maltose hydrolase-like predicted phosphorylase
VKPIYPYNEWEIVEENFDPENSMRNETLFSLGNGYLGWRGDWKALISMVHYHPLEMYRHQVCKQADLVLALFLLSKYFTKDTIKRNYEYYERLTPTGKL